MKAKDLWSEYQRYFPGGVNSPVRAFKAVKTKPIFIACARGSKIYDITGKEYIDYVLSWGALILGHCNPEVLSTIIEQLKKGTSYGVTTPLELTLAKKIIGAIPSIEKLRFTSTGTEAAMSSIRLARGYTGRDDIVRFNGCYHGSSDSLLINSSGIPKCLARHTITLPFNDLDAIKRCFKTRAKYISCVIVEPVVGNSGVILPEEDFLPYLREITKAHQALLIFDEVITGFRILYGGVQSLYNIDPDITILGKIIGGGLPCAAFGGKLKIMDCLAPDGSVYQAGTFSGNPLSMSAGNTTLEILSRPEAYDGVNARTERLCEGLKTIATSAGIDIRCPYIGSMFTIFFKNPEIYADFFKGMIKEGLLFPPSQFEAAFLSIAHTDEDIEKILKAGRKVFKSIK